MEIVSPLNGGAGFAGKSGRKTANACDANPMETTMNTAAHFMPPLLAGSSGMASKIFSRSR
jgi:hypothetical protein